MRTIEEAFKKIRSEHDRAIRGFPPFRSHHEGYAIIKEELDELWEAVKSGRDKENIRSEVIQVATMAVRFWMDLCERDIGSTRDFLDRSSISDEKTVRGVQRRFREFTGERIRATKARKLLSASAAEKGGRVKRENWKGRYWVVWRRKGRFVTRSRWP